MAGQYLKKNCSDVNIKAFLVMKNVSIDKVII